MDFRFVEFNDRRYARGAEAARVAVRSVAGEELLWMSKSDIKKNIKAFGPSAELLKAYEAYPG